MNPCIMCGSTSGELLFRRNDAHAIFPKLLFDIRRCKGCGLVFLSPVPSWDLLSKYYFAFDKIEASRPRPRPTHLLRPFISFMRRGEVVEKGLRLLDVGCGDGSYLREMQLKGLEVYGIDPDPIKVNIAQGKSLKVFCGTLMELEGFENYFRVVTFNHVFEHVPNPHEILVKCRELLTRNGMLIIQVPRADSSIAGIFTRDCMDFSVPFHLFNYSLQNLTALLKLHGFETVRVRHILDPWAFVQSVSLKIYGVEDQVRGGSRLLLLGVGLWFELLAMLFGKTASFEIWATLEQT